MIRAISSKLILVILICELKIIFLAEEKTSEQDITATIQVVKLKQDIGVADNGPIANQISNEKLLRIFLSTRG
jgi:hypothetical protein